jgi:threonine aldolase
MPSGVPQSMKVLTETDNSFFSSPTLTALAHERNMTKPLDRRQFASDNYAGVCPEAWQSLQASNLHHAMAYGNDPWTQRASDLLREVFETNCEVFFCFNGTAANSLSIAHLCQSYHSVVCHQLAHIETDECGGPEFFSNGTKILTVDGDHGWIDAKNVELIVTKRKDIHYPKPKVLSITQATEMGTVYSIAQIKELSDVASRFGMRVHMDGARFANAAATLGVAPKEITWQAGVDVLCFGGTKNGLPVGEAVIFFKPEMAAEFEYRCKQAGQLASKMRFIAAPWVGMLESGAWLRRAAAANACAQYLYRKLQAIDGLSFMTTPQANSVFVSMPIAWQQSLREMGWLFYNFIGAGGVRLMCSWDTTNDDIDALVRDISRVAM